MLDRLKASWKKLAQLAPGKRFQTFHRDQGNQSPAVKLAFFAGAFACFAVGVVLAFIPGPAILFFALSGALLGTQSLRVARWLDQGEVWGRKAVTAVRKWARRKRRRAR